MAQDSNELSGSIKRPATVSVWRPPLCCLANASYLLLLQAVGRAPCSRSVCRQVYQKRDSSQFARQLTAGSVLYGADMILIQIPGYKVGRIPV
jgi:hypothetical protein